MNSKNSTVIQLGTFIVILNIFVVNCDFMNSKNSTVIQLGTFIVSVLCQLQIKYYIFKVPIIQRIFKLQNHPFQDKCLYVFSVF
jgi:hypothetical protein